ncbi:esterase/lipase family protein [Tsukamurella paurometabola]|uniref:esterase/lipase family protein n=1 Tax=Tsukamurella paurometabola TaxID=2061 RepID=UPI000F7DF25A|nr:lipase [Tsukamurella paurometabola]UEA83511.1 lipase [Tsukamurella paurometabola]
MQILKKTLAAAAVALGTASVVPALAHAEQRDLVIVYAGLIAPGEVYEPLNTNLRNAGFEVKNLWLPGFDHRREAGQLKAAVDQAKQAAPKRRVSIVSHSSGAISSRYYVKVLGGSRDVARSVVLGGVEYGSPTGCVLPAPANGACNGSAILNQLNAGLDTPGPTEFYSIRSTRDPLSGNLDGRQCRASVQGYLPAAASFDHAWLAWDPRVVPLVVSSLRGNCPGQWVDSPEGSVTYENSVDMNRK